MQNDVTPKLLEEVRTDFSKRYAASGTIRALSKKLNAGTVTYPDAFRYAREVGNIRAKTFKNKLNSEKLPNGKMYYHIANDLLNDSLKSDYKAINQYCKVAQRNKNKQLKVGFNPQEEEIDQDNIDGLVNLISAAEQYDDRSLLLEMGLATFAKQVVDRSMQKNANFCKTIGVTVVIVRSSGAGCCPWCDSMGGTYEIGHAPDGIFGRHNDCNCTVDYERK